LHLQLCKRKQTCLWPLTACARPNMYNLAAARCDAEPISEIIAPNKLSLPPSLSFTIFTKETWGKVSGKFPNPAGQGEYHLITRAFTVGDAQSLQNVVGSAQPMAVSGVSRQARDARIRLSSVDTKKSLSLTCLYRTRRPPPSSFHAPYLNPSKERSKTALRFHPD
jgi:hypothetical protein